MAKIMEYVDICIANEEDAEMVWDQERFGYHCWRDQR